MPDRPPSVAVLYASVGGGHGRAAQAVAAALREMRPGARIDVIDVLAHTNRAFRHFYGRAYFQVYAKAPHLIGYLYDWLDRPPTSDNPLGDRFRRILQRANLSSFYDRLRSESWDAIINTHFLPAEIVAGLRRQGILRTPQATVVTDFDAHRLWVQSPTDRYFVASAEARATLRHWGVPAARVDVTGIPIDPVFSVPLSKEAARRRLGLDLGRRTVLQLAGGLGVGPVETVFRALLDIQQPLSLVVAAGTNDAAVRALGRVPAPPRHRVRVLKFRTDIDQWMAAADLVISKPGGLTSAECLARGVPLAIVHPIPGQESRNSDFLLEAGAAIKINTLPTLPHKLAHHLFNSPRLAAMSQKALHAARPRAAFEVARRTFDMIQKPVSSR
ncbi:MAG: UDP-N-acetylglucosamine--LPS N-acetylglucosamine transferase [Elusimicrobia bacterium]|nr:UDP-N-acetylglucosamine--LPS N-acetylglucosamine transferase [Elusimicrobiota bacterium]